MSNEQKPFNVPALHIKDKVSHLNVECRQDWYEKLKAQHYLVDKNSFAIQNIEPFEIFVRNNTRLNNKE